MKIETSKPANQRDVTKERVATWLVMHQATRVLQEHVERRLDESTHLSWLEFELLWRLKLAADHPLQMNELAARLLASPSGITRVADRLEREGLITRETPTDNRRIVQVALTPLGASTLADADRAFHDGLREAMSDALTADDGVRLRRIMRKLLEHNGAWSAERCDPMATP
ncbi:MAG TPA: MarR family transcriptional regulator [Actinomycetota bacterium]